MTDSLRAALFETIFYQRPLKAPEIGRCLFEEEPRLEKAHPLFQRRILLETVNQLRIRRPGQPDRPLTLEERNSVLLALDGKVAKALTSANVSFTQLRRVLKLTPDQTFSLESEARKGIACDSIRAIMAYKDRYGPRWTTLDTARQWELIERVRAVESDANNAEVVSWLQEAHGLEPENAQAVVNAPLPEGYGRIGIKATEALLPLLEAEVISYSDAVARVYGHHSDFRTGEVFSKLPYYGQVLDRHVIPGSNNPEDDDVKRFGRITNPTVHIGLNQLRRLVNRLIDVHGLPDEIVVELARDLKLGEKQRAEVQKTIRKNTDAAIRRGEALTECNIRDNGANRLMMRLWEELGQDPLDRRCPYSGEQISLTRLFSGDCDVDHILPFSRTLDDSPANRVICLREANRTKRNLSPFEAWGRDPEKWSIIEQQIKKLPSNKQWRFAPDAMEKFNDEAKFLDRQLVDTQYLSRIAREYLSRLHPDRGDGSAHVRVVPGRLTEMLRRHWGLNGLLSDHNRASKAKNRSDHRHHAIDAAVVGATDQGLIQRIQRASARAEEQGLEDVIRDINPPWEGYRDDLKTQLDRMIVSHRADHGRITARREADGQDSTSGQLHNDTAYGLTGERQNGVPLVVTRKPFESLSPAQIGKIRDRDLAAALHAATDGLEGKAFTDALARFRAAPGPYRGIRRVRLIEPVEVIEIVDETGKTYKGYKPDSNHCFEVWQLPGGDWTHNVVSTFDAHRGHFSRPHPAAKRLLRLHKNDMVRLDNSKFGPVVATVEKFDTSGTITLVAHNESNADQRYRKTNEDVFIRLRPASLKHAGVRRIIVDELGRYRDPGPLKG